MKSPRITKVEAHHQTGTILHLSDGSAIEMAPAQACDSVPGMGLQRTVVVALRDLLRRARSGGEREP
jgi:hypothetical protein